MITSWFGRALAITTTTGTFLGCTCTSQPANGTYEIATAAPEPHVLTILHGQLDAAVNADGTACLWVITWQRRTAVVWPTGFTARGNPIAVYDAAGKLFATAGKSVDIAGGQVYSTVNHPVSGCSGLGQSIKAGPMRNAREATPGSRTFDQNQISDMAAIVYANRDTFGGLWGDQTTHVVTIYVAAKADKKTADKLHEQLLGATSAANTAEPWRVGFLTGGPSLAELDAVVNEVSTSSHWSTVNRDNLLRYEIAQERQAANFEVDVITPSMSAAAVAEFGSMMSLETRNYNVPKRPTLAAGMVRYRIATASRPGMASMLALASGKLDGQVNPDGTACFWLGDGTNRYAIFWPFGFSAAGLPLTVYDTDGRKAATVGQEVSMGGGNGPDGTANPLGCSGKFAAVFFAAPQIDIH
jgi:hypothetical protein